MYGAQHQRILLIGAPARQILRGLRRLEGQRREKGAAVGVAAGNDLQLVEVREAWLHPVVLLAQNVVVDEAHPRDVLADRTCVVVPPPQLVQQHA